MLLSLTGASGAGKSTALASLQTVDFGAPVTALEFDSIGVPPDADTAWRHGAIEHWVQRAIEEQEQGRHMLLCGQVPIGELLAAPSADALGDIAVCVLHCSPEVRRERLLARGEPADSIVHHVRFGQWFLEHALDPTHAPDVIRVESTVPMRWDRSAGWVKGDPRWRARVLDTDGLTPPEVASRVEDWVREELR